MTKLKVINQEDLKDWAKEIFQKNSFNMVDVSSKKETFRRALASGKIYVGKEVFDLIKNKNANVFDCKKEEHAIAEILYITANALSAQNIYPRSEEHTSELQSR